MHVQPYLMFPGTCRRALEFYCEALGGEIQHLQTIGESPIPAPPEHADRVFNAAFAAGDLRFMASDGELGREPSAGENFAMFVGCGSDEEQRRVFEALSVGGRVLMPRSDGFGMVEDSFRVRWMIAVGR